MKLWKQKVVESTFERSPALRAALVELMDRVIEHHKTEPLMTFDGRPLTDEEVEHVLPLDKGRIDRVVTRIVRCLHYEHEGTPLPQGSTYEVAVDPLNEAEIETLIRDRSGLVGGKQGEFVYRYVAVDANTWDWVLMFYLTHHFRVRVAVP